MLDYFIMLLFDFAWLTLWGLIAFVSFMTFQLIAYRVFHKNPYKWILNKLEIN